jgi:hypothetical protein
VPTGEPAALPDGSVQVAGRAVPVRSLSSSVIALVPASCDCGLGLQRLAGQAASADAKLYFAAGGQALAQLAGLTTRYGGGTAIAAADSDGVLTNAYRPSGLTVLLVFRDATAEVLRNLSADFELATVMRELGQARPGPAAGQSTAS